MFKALSDLTPDYLSSMFAELCLKGLFKQIKCPFTKNYLKGALLSIEVQLSGTVYPAT